MHIATPLGRWKVERGRASEKVRSTSSIEKIRACSEVSDGGREFPKVSHPSGPVREVGPFDVSLGDPHWIGKRSLERAGDRKSVV